MVFEANTVNQSFDNFRTLIIYVFMLKEVRFRNDVILNEKILGSTLKHKTMFYDQDICPVFLSVGQIWTEFLVTDLFYFESDHYLAQKVVVVGQG